MSVSGRGGGSRRPLRMRFLRAVTPPPPSTLDLTCETFCQEALGNGRYNLVIVKMNICFYFMFGIFNNPHIYLWLQTFKKH